MRKSSFNGATALLRRALAANPTHVDAMNWLNGGRETPALRGPSGDMVVRS
jgi:hypothetical protein